MEDILYKGISEFGVISTMFVVMLMFMLYAMFKWLPKAWQAHLDAIDKIQDKFSKDLTAITTEHSETNQGFLRQIEKLSVDHEKQNKILDKLSRVQDEINTKIS